MTYQFTRPKVNVPLPLAYKWSMPVMDEGFVPFPKRFLRCLSQIVKEVVDLQVIMAIADYACYDLIRQPSYDRLAFTAGMSPELFKDRVDSMCQRGWLNVWGNDDAITIRLDGLMHQIEQATSEIPPSSSSKDPATPT